MSYYYRFLEDVEPDMAELLEELERVVFRSPRAMVTHSRTLIELVLQRAEEHEGVTFPEMVRLSERIYDARNVYNFPPTVQEALHRIRKYGNEAAHDPGTVRMIRALLVWHLLYDVMKWYVTTYVKPSMEYPAYADPELCASDSRELGEVMVRLEQLERMIAHRETKDVSAPREEVGLSLPGMTTVRTLTFREETIDIPYFLRDALLLPQRFEQSESYLISLHKVQEARFMSELPYTLDDLHERVKRRNVSHTERFVEELRLFIAEEVRRQRVKRERKGDGELLIFYAGEEIVMTEDRARVAIDEQLLPGLPGLVAQLKRDGMTTVGSLPREFVLLGKYDGIGKKRLEEAWEAIRSIE